LPASARNFLPWSVVSRPLKGAAPSIDVVCAYHKANTSPILKRFLARIDQLSPASPAETAKSRVSSKRAN
jgi:LysR family hca operon transcriptional activator